MSAIKVWDNVQNDLNIKHMASNKQKITHGKQFTIECHLQISYRIQKMNSKKFIIKNDSH